MLRILDAGNLGLSLMGKLVTAASLSTVAVSFGTGAYQSYCHVVNAIDKWLLGIYIISTAYGAYALQQFVGKEFVSTLLPFAPQ